MDKADILELTVQHLQSMQQRHRQVKYSAGYEECAGEVNHYMSRTPVHPDLSARLMQHLDGQLMKENRAPTTSPGRIIPTCPSPSYGVPCTTPLSSLPGLCYVAATPGGLTAHHETAAAPYSGSLSGRVSLQAAGHRPQDTRTSSPLIADDVPDTDYGRISATGPHCRSMDSSDVSLSVSALPLGTLAMKHEESSSVWRPWWHASRGVAHCVTNTWTTHKRLLRHMFSGRVLIYGNVCAQSSSVTLNKQYQLPNYILSTSSHATCLLLHLKVLSRSLKEKMKRLHSIDTSWCVRIVTFTMKKTVHLYCSQRLMIIHFKTGRRSIELPVSEQCDICYVRFDDLAAFVYRGLKASPHVQRYILFIQWWCDNKTNV